MEMVLLEYVEFVAKDPKLLQKKNGINPSTKHGTLNAQPKEQKDKK
jgi:hypothetical protein